MKRAWIIAVAAALAAPAAANDSVATTAAGGLELTRSAEIDMVSEDLFVSADEVRVRYVFRNRAPRDVRTIVAFPMPDRHLSAQRVGDVAFPEGFETRVDGAPVPMRLEHKAMLDGTDHTALLDSLGIPRSDVPDALGRYINQRLDALPEADKARLIALGLAEVDEYDEGRGIERHLIPLWIVKQTWHWEQLFPAGRDLVVEHRYKPGVGGTVITSLTEPEFRASPAGRRKIAAYCIDSAFLTGLDRMAREKAPPGGARTRIINEQWIGYILTTGGNWRAPIGDFRLTVDKGAPENLVSFCGEGVRKVGPTRFEMRQTNWRPNRDLVVLILIPHWIEE